MKKINSELLPRMDGVKNSYNPFSIDFLQHNEEKHQILNGEFNVTDAPKKLIGVPTGTETIKLTDYLVYRPIPEELLQWREIPAFHPDSIEMEQWYSELITYCIHGVWIDGEYWNPFMVYWLNVFMFPVYHLDKDGNPTEDFEPNNPYYCNIDRYLLDVLWSCEVQRKDFALMGGRGIGKSFLIGSVLDREYRLFPNSWSVVSSTNEETTNEAWNKIEQCLTAIEKAHRALKHKRITDSLSMKYTGEIIELPDGTNEDRGYLSKIEKIIYGKNSGKTRGKRPTKQLIEEFAAFPPSKQKGSLKACQRESKGSWYVGGSLKKCTVMYAGTGGTVENDEAESIFTNPKAYNIYPVYDFSESGSGCFVPTHIKRTGTWEKTGCPDIATAHREVLVERQAAKSDPETYMGLLQEFPITIAEVFTRRGANIFNQEKIATQRIAIEHTPGIPKPEKGFLNWVYAENGRAIGVEWDPSPVGDIEIIEHPHWLTTSDESEKSPMKNLYVGGVDSIDQGTMDSSYATDSNKGSSLAMMVKKRLIDKKYFGVTSNLYVAKYVKRSADVRKDWDNALKLAVYYNSEVNIEYTKIGIVGWFRDHGYYHLLKKRPTINLGNADPNKASHLIGTTAGGPIIDHQDQKIAQYIDDYYREIWFPDLLTQLQDYNRDDRTKFDLVVAMGLCELADEDLMGAPARKPEAITAGLKLWGYYTDPETGYKKHGVLPEASDAEKDMKTMLEAEKFKQHGGVRWIDATDPSNPVYVYE